MQFDQILDQCKAEAQPAHPAGAGHIALAERFKNIRKKLWIDTFTGVADDDLNIRIGPLESNVDPAAFRCELDCIREQVPDDLLQSLWVTGDLAGKRIQDVG